MLSSLSMEQCVYGSGVRCEAPSGAGPRTGASVVLCKSNSVITCLLTHRLWVLFVFYQVSRPSLSAVLGLCFCKKNVAHVSGCL